MDVVLVYSMRMTFYLLLLLRFPWKAQSTASCVRDCNTNTKQILYKQYHINTQICLFVSHNNMLHLQNKTEDVHP